MKDSAAEGYYYHPNTTALEAQRIGLQTIRDAVGDSVLLDKDGSEMLKPVGILDMGRIRRTRATPSTRVRMLPPALRLASL
jgi:alpha-galactosidase